ncbi:MAG TPA: type II/IV secretion system protein [Candidatus Saccharimonadales bacterium]|nr:type II/IV secretion system protein [Candidatus Saccharimonadales bacterium]
MALKTFPAGTTRATSRGFLDLLIDKGLLKSGFRQVLASYELDELEKYLVDKQLMTKEHLAQLFAEYFSLPFARLVNRPILPEVARLLPLETIERYKVLPYDLQSVNLFLAVGEPSRLQKNAPQTLLKLRQQKGLRIHLTIVPEDDFAAIVAKLKSTALPTLPEPKPPVTPTAEPKHETLAAVHTTEPSHPEVIKKVEQQQKFVDLTHMEIPPDVLNKIPYNVASKYHLIVFGQEKPKSQFEPALIKIAILNPNDSHIKEIVGYIEQKNKVLVDRYLTDQKSFDKALSGYPETQKATTEELVIEGDEKPLPPVPEAKKPEPEVKPAPISPPSIPAVVKHPIEPEKVPPPAAPAQVAKEPARPEAVSVSETGVEVSSADIITRPTEESAAELQRLAREQQLTAEDQNLDRLLRKPILSAEELAGVFKTGIVPEIVAATLFLAIRMEASDIHIEAGAETVRVRFRIDGILHDIVTVPHFLHAPLISRIKILAKMKIDEQRIPQDGRFDVVIDKRQVDLRVSTMPTVHGEKVVMRLLDKSAGIISLEQLGLTGSGFDTLIANVVKPYGVILSTGPTGSGKSTTLYAILNRISKPGVNIITLEDPVEYELAGINQAQVKPQIGFTFAEGLRSVLRQDPNVIMVGEIRDLETAAMATHAALTGHLVLSTLHTNDAPGALPRLINMGVEPFLITSSINAVIGQRLVRKVCEHCKEPAEIPNTVKAYIQKELAAIPSGQLKNVNLDQLVFYHGKGCQHCTNGYKGRIGIFEVLSMNEEIEELAVRKAPSSEIKKSAIKTGMVTMTQDGLIKALKGITTVDEVLRVTTTEIKEMPAVEK